MGAGLHSLQPVAGRGSASCMLADTGGLCMKAAAAKCGLWLGTQHCAQPNRYIRYTQPQLGW